MPSQPVPWDRKEGRSEFDSVNSFQLLERHVEEHGNLIKGASQVRDISLQSEKSVEDACQFGMHCSPSSASDESFHRNSQLFGNNQGQTDFSVGIARNSIRWVCSGSLSSHELGLSNSISSKSVSLDFANSKVDVRKRNMNSCQSASGDAFSCVTPTTPFEETSPWKRPRLKWGEGLAKFEKKSLILDDEPNKSETISCISAQLSDCASPATPSSAACCSSPGSEDKLFAKAVVASNANNSSYTLISERQQHHESIPFNLEKVDLSTVIDVVPSLIEVMKPDSLCSKNSGSTSSSVMNTLLLLKSEILKAVDLTESELDSLENELKSINNEYRHNDCYLASDPLKELIEASQGTSEMSNEPAFLLNKSSDMVVVEELVYSGNSDVLNADMDITGTLVSKLVEPPSTEPNSLSDMIYDGDSVFEFDASCLPDVQKSSSIASHAGNIGNVYMSGAVVSNTNSFVTSDSDFYLAVDERVIDSIWASNREYANKATEDLNIVYPLAKTVECSSSDWHSKDLSFQQLVVRRKKALRFKEQAVALKWRAARSSWKEDMRISCLQNHCSRTSLNNHPSVHTKSAHVKKSSLDTGKLLSSSYLKPCNKLLRMPSLIMDGDEKRTCRFFSSNGLVEDPCAAEKERSMINIWTSEERDLFLDKLLSHGKDFRKIASFLDHKTTADCIQFYYKNHKSDSFTITKTVKKQERRMYVKSFSKSTYLVTPAKKWNRNMDTASLEILGAASELVARNSERKESKKVSSSGLLLFDVGRTRPPRRDALPVRRSGFRFGELETGTSDNEILHGVCGSVSSEAVSSCITNSVNQGEGRCSGTPKIFSIHSIPSSIPEDILFGNEETCSDESSCELNVCHWTDVEKSVFLRAVRSYGKDFCMVSRCIGTKSKDQCKSFYSKVRKCLGLDTIHPDNDHQQQSVINDNNGDKSAPVLTSTQDAVSEIGGHKVSQRIDEAVSLNESVMSIVDSLSPDAGMTSHACSDISKEIGGNLEKPYADLKIECQLMDKSTSTQNPVCVGSKPTMSMDTDKPAFPSRYSESASKPVNIPFPPLSFTVPYFASSAHLETEKDMMESSLLQCHVGENGTSIHNIQNKVSCFTEDRVTPKAPCQRSADNQPLAGLTAGIPRQMYVSKTSVRSVSSQNRLAFRTSCGLLNQTQQSIAGLPTSEIAFSRNSPGETQRHLQGSHYAVNRVMQQTYVPGNQFYVSQTFQKVGENNESSWNLNFKDSTISRGSHSDSVNGLPCYARSSLVQKRDDWNYSSLSNLNQGSHYSRNQMTNSVGSEKQGTQANVKLFGQVLIPSAVPETRSMVETKGTQFPQLNCSPVDITPLNHPNNMWASENLPERNFWDGHQMQNGPLLAGCHIPLPYCMSSSSVLDRKLFPTTAVPDVNAPQTTVRLRYANPHISHEATTRRDL